jgi:putative secretion ATPase (PEP-CTERM system associated)
MYEKHFQLRERPFALSPDPEYLYPSRVHQEALGYLRYGLEGHAGFVVITGEIGSGKTTLLQTLLSRLDANTTVARIVNTMLDSRELLESIMLDFGINPTGMSKPVLLHTLADFLVRQRQSGRLALLVIDEAQNLSLPALEEIRMLSNLETEKSKLLQIIMVGQPQLREKLRLPHLEQLRQRITVSYHLEPLDADDTARYINHRVKRASIGAPLEFPPDVTALIHRRSRGVPRIINVIGDATLLFAYGVDRHGVDVAITEEALAELDATGVLASYHTEGDRAAAASSIAVSEAVEAMQLADTMRRREHDMGERERHLSDREQAIAAQQRVLEEQARLLASHSAHAASPSAVAVASHVPVRAVPPIAAGAASAGPAGYEPARPAHAPAVRLGRDAGRPGGEAGRGRLRDDGVATRVPAGPFAASARVRVQSVQQPDRDQGPRWWGRLRRALFGATEPGVRA